MFRPTFLTLLLALTACGGTTPKAPDQSQPDPVVPLAPALEHYGKGYEAWIAAWVQWKFAIPKAASPELDETGARCGTAQSGPVFFLAGADHSVNRACTVSSTLAILVPVAPSVEDELGVPLAERGPPEDLPGKLAVLESELKSPDFTMDRTSYSNLSTYLFPVVELVFTESTQDPLVPLADDQQDGRADPAYAGGVFLLLPPLSAGVHRLIYGYTPEGGAPIRITYDLTVM